MACCNGGSRPQRIRKQIVAAQESKSEPVQKRLGQSPASVQRQSVVPRQQCAKCGYPSMAVVIAGRERIQCSNVNCRIIIQ